MRHLDLFSGIGGFALAAQMVWGDDYENIAFCDNNEFCQEALRKNFPGCTIIGDVREVTANTEGWQSRQQTRWSEASERNTKRRSGFSRTNSVDLITGGFPCQPFSCAGKRKGQDDDRYLWPEMLRVIHEFQPRWVIGENVAGFVEMALRQVHTDLEGEGYEVGSFIIPACAVNAPHRRDRVWIVANRKCNNNGGGNGTLRRLRQPKEVQRNVASTADSQGAGLPQGGSARGETQARDARRGGHTDNVSPDWQRDWREVAFATCLHRVDDGLPRRLVRLPSGRTISRARWRTEALKAYGNAIVPQVAAEIMFAIKAVDNAKN